MFSRRPVRRTRSGRYSVNLGADERNLLRILPGQLRALLAAEGGVPSETEDSSLRRLFPPAYSSPEHQDHAEEFRRLMTEDLLERHTGALETLEASADATELTEEQLDAWMRALNSLRLVLGTSLDVTDDDDLTTHMTDRHTLYYFLGYLQECVVEALSRDD